MLRCSTRLLVLPLLCMLLLLLLPDSFISENSPQKSASIRRADRLPITCIVKSRDLFVQIIFAFDFVVRSTRAVEHGVWGRMRGNRYGHYRTCARCAVMTSLLSDRRVTFMRQFVQLIERRFWLFKVSEALVICKHFFVKI